MKTLDHVGKAKQAARFQGYHSVHENGKPVTDEEVREHFTAHFGYPPKEIHRDGGGIYAGPIEEGPCNEEPTRP